MRGTYCIVKEFNLNKSNVFFLFFDIKSFLFLCPFVLYNLYTYTTPLTPNKQTRVKRRVYRYNIWRMCIIQK